LHTEPHEGVLPPLRNPVQRGVFQASGDSICVLNLGFVFLTFNCKQSNLKHILWYIQTKGGAHDGEEQQSWLGSTIPTRRAPVGGVNFSTILHFAVTGATLPCGRFYFQPGAHRRQRPLVLFTSGRFLAQNVTLRLF
ncbi:MAG: hypothetical protein M3Q45_03170, partial [Chloroflexota bacterium]|nr:hypothetical protein [Chloroflexota bacterium]